MPDGRVSPHSVAVRYGNSTKPVLVIGPEAQAALAKAWARKVART